MSFFEGQYRSRPNINLSGASRPKTKEELIREAYLERQKRERERTVLNACIKIQSVYRSYLVRKRIKESYRNEFDSKTQNEKDQFNEQNLAVLLNLFVKFFNKNIENDKKRLIKISNLVIRQKHLIKKSIGQVKNRSFGFTLAKFLVIQLKCLNQPETGLNQSTTLRIIDFFTDPMTYADQNNQETMILLFSYLVKNDYIKELAEFSINKIPASAHYVTSIPIADSIAQLFYRCFVYIKPQTNQSIDEYNKTIVNGITEQLFIRANLPQIKCIFENLAKTIGKNETKIQKMIEFLVIYSKLSEQKNQDENLIESIQIFSIDTVKKSLLKLFSILKLFSNIFQKLNNQQFYDLLKIIQALLIQIPILSIESIIEIISDINEDEEDDEPMNSLEPENQQKNIPKLFVNQKILDEIIELLDSDLVLQKIKSILSNAESKSDSNIDLKEFCLSVSSIIHFVLFNANKKIHQSSLARKLAFDKFYMLTLWHSINSLTIKAQANQEIFLLQMLASGSCPDIYYNNLFKLVAPLSTFCSLYNLFLLSIFDKEFLEGQAIFSKMDLIKMSSLLKDISIGIVDLMHPDVNTASMRNTFNEFSPYKTRLSTEPLPKTYSNETMVKAKCFSHLFLTCVNLLQRMHRRDIRFGFCPEDHWISNSKYVASNRLTAILQAHDPSLLTNIKFGQTSYIFQTDLDSENKLTLNDIRSLTILQELPFTVSFSERIQVLENSILNEPIYSRESQHQIRVRRDYLYEDAFDELSPENVQNFKSIRLVIQMINQFGMEEVGIDGGGIYREFMLKLLETGFDPNRGFFVLTSDGFLYPNPNVASLEKNYKAHYYFLGRMLGKAIQTKLLSPLKFAGFFLQKILISEHRLDIDYLATLDPQISKNLLSLKDYEHDVKDLELNFAINLNEFGQTRLVELKPGGKDIPVTNDNKIEYIFLLADYKLNRQIHEQTIAFRQGISNVINLDLLKLFNINEIQNLISGSDESIDVDDWKRYTVYSGFTPDSKVIEIFWDVVESFDQEQRKKLLKFATSRSRPPLFGFKNLIPNFAIHNSGSADRLPSASTCLNLLKIPPVEDYRTLKDKLICAIESESGFDLS